MRRVVMALLGIGSGKVPARPRALRKRRIEHTLALQGLSRGAAKLMAGML